MSKYTEANLNAMRKDDLVSVALKLSNELDEINSGPLTADAVKSKLLALKKEAILSKERREANEQQYLLQVQKLEEESERAKAELELKYKASNGVEEDKLENLFKALEARAKDQEKDLSFGLEEAEVEASIKLSEINKKVSDAEEKLEKAEEESEEGISSLSDEFKAKISKIKTDHAREVEQLTYDNKIALRDKNSKYLNDAAEALGMVVVKSADYTELKEFKAQEEEAVEEAITSAVAKAKSEVYASEGAKLSKTTSDFSSKVALLENDKKHLEASLTNANARINDLEARLKDVPAQIATAVASARSEVTVNQDTNKK